MNANGSPTGRNGNNTNGGWNGNGNNSNGGWNGGGNGNGNNSNQAKKGPQQLSIGQMNSFIQRQNGPKNKFVIPDNSSSSSYSSAFGMGGFGGVGKMGGFGPSRGAGVKSSGLPPEIAALAKPYQPTNGNANGGNNNGGNNGGPNNGGGANNNNNNNVRKQPQFLSPGPNSFSRGAGQSETSPQNILRTFGVPFVSQKKEQNNQQGGEQRMDERTGGQVAQGAQTTNDGGGRPSQRRSFPTTNHQQQTEKMDDGAGEGQDGREGQEGQEGQDNNGTEERNEQQRVRQNVRPPQHNQRQGRLETNQRPTQPPPVPTNIDPTTGMRKGNNLTARDTLALVEKWATEGSAANGALGSGPTGTKVDIFQQANDATNNTMNDPPPLFAASAQYVREEATRNATQKGWTSRTDADSDAAGTATNTFESFTVSKKGGNGGNGTN